MRHSSILSLSLKRFGTDTIWKCGTTGTIVQASNKKMFIAPIRKQSKIKTADTHARRNYLPSDEEWKQLEITYFHMLEWTD